MGTWPNVTCGLMFPWRFQKMRRFNETRALSRRPELNVRSLFLITNWKRLCGVPLWSLWVVINNPARYFSLLSHYSGEDKRLTERTLTARTWRSSRRAEDRSKTLYSNSAEESRTVSAVYNTNASCKCTNWRRAHLWSKDYKCFSFLCWKSMPLHLR